VNRGDPDVGERLVALDGLSGADIGGVGDQRKRAVEDLRLCHGVFIHRPGEALGGQAGLEEALRISEEPDSNFTKSLTAVSVSPGHWGFGWCLRCCHLSSVMISGFSGGVNAGLALLLRMLSPFSSMRWALWMMRSGMASAMVGSPII
jgi:hypothetical protein